MRLEYRWVYLFSFSVSFYAHAQRGVLEGMRVKTDWGTSFEIQIGMARRFLRAQVLFDNWWTWLRIVCSRFPMKQPEMLRSWLNSMQLGENFLPKKGMKLCSDHFEKECLKKPGVNVTLAEGSIPKLFGIPKSACVYCRSIKKPGDPRTFHRYCISIWAVWFVLYYFTLSPIITIHIFVPKDGFILDILN